MLVILDPYRIFYINMERSKDGMGACFCKQMIQLSQEIQRHKKRPVESVNLTSTWKECDYDQFPSS